MLGGRRSRSLHGHLCKWTLEGDLISIQCMGRVQKKGKKPDTNSQKKRSNRIERLSQSKSFESLRRGSRFGGDSAVTWRTAQGNPSLSFGGALYCLFPCQIQTIYCCTLIARTPAVIRYPESETIPIKTLLDWPGEP